MHRLNYPDWCVDLPAQWFDVSEIEDAACCFAKDNGAGALQFSIAVYRGGEIPNPTSQDLRDMIQTFVEGRGWSSLGEGCCEDGLLRIASESFRDDEWLVRVWYVSGGCSIAFITYTCNLKSDPTEVPDCERIVRSLRFVRYPQPTAQHDS